MDRRFKAAHASGGFLSWLAVAVFAGLATLAFNPSDAHADPGDGVTLTLTVPRILRPLGEPGGGSATLQLNYVISRMAAGSLTTARRARPVAAYARSRTSYTSSVQLIWANGLLARLRRFAARLDAQDRPHN